MWHRHLIAVCDLSLIKWDLFQIIFNHRDVLAFEQIVNRLRTNRLIESRVWHSTCLSLEYQTHLRRLSRQVATGTLWAVAWPKTAGVEYRCIWKNNPKRTSTRGLHCA